jgi:FMN reductase (NADPH)
MLLSTLRALPISLESPSSRMLPRMELDSRLTVFAKHRTTRKFKNQPLEPGHLEQLMYCAQRAPTDATAQMYSFIRLSDSTLKQQVAQWTNNAHIATSAEAFIICLDVYRLQRILEHRGYEFGNWSAVAVHFGLGDAALAAQTMMVAAECLGYQGCWIGGVLSALEPIIEACQLPVGVLPYAGLAIGVPDEDPGERPRVQPELVLHENTYRQPEPQELEEALNRMASITARGDWAQMLSRYFAKGGAMESREVALRQALEHQGFDHVQSDLATLHAQARQAGFNEISIKHHGEGFQAWVNRPEWAYSGDGETPIQALKHAIEKASRETELRQGKAQSLD